MSAIVYPRGFSYGDWRYTRDRRIFAMKPDNGKGYYMVTALNTIFAPPVPKTITQGYLHMYNIDRPRYLYDSNIFAAFAPAVMRFDGLVLEHLNYTPMTLRIERLELPSARLYGRTVTRYRIYQDLHDALYNMDIMQHRIITFLHRKIKHLPLHLDISTYARPWYVGYAVKFASKRDLVQALLKVKQAFVVRWVYVAFLDCLATEQTDKYGKPPAWVDELRGTEELPHYVIDSLLNTWVLDKRVPRVGGMVDMSNGEVVNNSHSDYSTTWLSELHRIATLMPHMPLWLKYNTFVMPASRQFDISRYFRPSEADGKNAINAFNWTDPNTNPSSQPTESKQVRRPERVRGTSFFDYAAQLREWLQHKRATGTGAQLTAGDEFETQCRDRPPDQRRSNVWAWELVEQTDGKRIWSLEFYSKRDTVSSLWDRTDPSGRIYNMFYDEWDVCPEIYEPYDAPETIGVPELDGNEEDFDDDEYTGIPHVPAAIETNVPVDQDNMMNVLLPTTDAPFHIERQHIDETIRDRLGIIPSRDIQDSSPITDDVIRILGIQTEEEAIGDEYLHSTRQFLEQLSHNIMPTDNICDWQLNVVHISSMGDFAMRVMRCGDGWLLDTDTTSTAITQGSNHDVHWTIYIEDPLSVMQLIRTEQSRSKIHMATVLCKKGIAFKLIVTTTDRPTVAYAPDSGGSPMPVNNTIAVSKPFLDYAIYEEARQHLLTNQRVALAALQAGGITWRLAIESVDVAAAIRLGPSEDTVNGKVLKLPDGKWGISNGLSDYEALLLAGTYRADNGPSDAPNAYKWERAWWPTADSWASCGYNHGYWTPRNENWYINRRTRIHNNALEDPLQTQKDWKRTTRGERRWSSIATSMDKHARIALDEVWLHIK